MFSATRPLFEHVFRERFTEVEGINLRAPCEFVEPLVDGESRGVCGVIVRDEDGTTREITADLVVDATGRTSRTPGWLEKNGYKPPAVDEVHIDVGYSTHSSNARPLLSPQSSSLPRLPTFAGVLHSPSRTTTGWWYYQVSTVTTHRLTSRDSRSSRRVYRPLKSLLSLRAAHS